MKLSGVYTKVILTIIAICLMALVIQTGLNIFNYSAEARQSKRDYPNIQVFPIGDIPAEDVKEIITLGDQHTFILHQKNGIRVFRVDYVLE